MNVMGQMDHFLSGMIVSGIVLRNVRFLRLEESLDQDLSSILR